MAKAKLNILISLSKSEDKTTQSFSTDFINRLADKIDYFTS